MRPTIFLLFLLPVAAGAQAGTIVEFDQAAGVTRILTPRGSRIDTTKSNGSRSVKLGDGRSAQIRVVNTNTALYKLTRDVASSGSSPMETVRGFLSKLGPYFPELGLALAGAPSSHAG